MPTSTINSAAAQSHSDNDNGGSGIPHSGNQLIPPEIVYLMFGLVVVLQIAIHAWKKFHTSSYNLTTLILMWMLPGVWSMYLEFWRMSLIWSIYTTITLYVGLLAMRRPLELDTPRKVYRWFYSVYAVSNWTGNLGIFATVLCVLRVPHVLLSYVVGAATQLWLLQYIVPGSLLCLFYGLYFGVLVRDCAEFCANRMASTMSINKRHYQPHICGICGHDFFDVEETSAFSSSSSSNSSSFSSRFAQQRQSASSEVTATTATAVIDKVWIGVLSVSNKFAELLSMLLSWREQSENTFKLPCGHSFHESCIRGWLIVGKKDTCPYCNEKVDLKAMFRSTHRGLRIVSSALSSSTTTTTTATATTTATNDAESHLPWRRSSLLWLQFLDTVRYFIVWNPIILLVLHFVTSQLSGYGGSHQQQHF